MSILEAFKGAAAEVRDTPGGTLGARLSAAARLAATIGRELGGMPALLPWAARARLDRARTPAPGKGRGGGVTLVRDVRYGPGRRQVADVWVPAEKKEGGGSGGLHPPPPASPPLLPVALLIHGGVWSSGDKWTLGPAAAALAQASGAAVAVPNYALWPSGEGRHGSGGGGGGLDAGAADVAAALGWALAGGVGVALGGAAAAPAATPTRVTLVGHSAGAHLATLAALAWSGGSGGEGGRGAPSASPAAVVSLAGVFDLPSHYEYERGRGVHYLSTMARAAGGAVRWEDERDDGPSPLARAPTPREAAGLEACSPLSRGASRWAARARPGLGRCLAAVPARLPRTWLLLAGGSDGTVPPSQSTAFAGALRRAGVRDVRCEVLEGVGHVDFVTGWGGGGWTAAVAKVVRG